MPYSKPARDNLIRALSQVVLATKTVYFYTRVLWQAVRQLYNWEITDGQFIDTQIRLIEEQLTRAWNAGARDMGVDPDEMTDGDLATLQAIKDNEYQYVLRLAQDVVNARAFKTGVDQFRSRVDLWANRYNETESRARIHFGGKQRLIWELGPTEEHCKTGDRPGKVGCADLAGMVAYAEEWEQAQIAPQSGVLACEGWRCGCKLKPTSARRSPRALDRLLDMMTGANV